MTPARRAEGALLVVSALWGFSFTVIKLGLADAPPFTFLALRFAAGLVMALPLLARPSRAALVPGAVLALALGGSYLAQTVGLQYTTPARSAFVTGLSVVLVPLFYPAIIRRLPRPLPVAGAVLAAGGLYFLTDPGSGALNRGDVYTLGCAGGYALFVILLERYARRHPYRELLTVQLAGLAVLFAPFAAAEGGPHRWSADLGLSVAGAAFILAATLALQNRYQKDTTATKAAVLFASEPLFAAGISFLVFGEVLGPVQWAGGALILAGILVAERR